jgi:hypothetical protein
MSDNENGNGTSDAPERSRGDGVGVDVGETSEARDTTGGCHRDECETLDDDGSPVEEECVICFEALATREWGRCTPCGHAFHGECWRSWEGAHARRVRDESLRRGGGRPPRSEDGCKCCLCNRVNVAFVSGEGIPSHGAATPHIAADDPDDAGRGSNRFVRFFRNVGEGASGFVTSLHGEVRDHWDNRAGDASSFVPPFFRTRTSSNDGTEGGGGTGPSFFAPPFFGGQSNNRQQVHSSNANPFNLLRPGTRVATQNLVRSPHLNHRGGIVLQYQPESARYLVRLESDVVSNFITGNSTAPVSIRPENLLQTSRIKIQGLRTEPRLNGKEGIICSYSIATNRYVVKVSNLLSTRDISLQPANIRVPNGTLVRLEGLQQASQWNGKYGTVTSFVEDGNGAADSGRYEVRLSRQYGVRVKMDNVRF